MYNNLKNLKSYGLKIIIVEGVIEISKYFLRHKIPTSTLLNNKKITKTNQAYGKMLCQFKH